MVGGHFGDAWSLVPSESSYCCCYFCFLRYIVIYWSSRGNVGDPCICGGWAVYTSILVWVKASIFSLVGSEGLSPAKRYHLLAIFPAPCRSWFSKQASISAPAAATLSFLSCLRLLSICLVSTLACCLLWCLSLRSRHLLAIDLLVSCEIQEVLGWPSAVGGGHCLPKF